jgi:hypothetical protein
METRVNLTALRRKSQASVRVQYIQDYNTTDKM